MRSCLTKISNVFRKKSTQNQLEFNPQQQLHDKCQEQQHDNDNDEHGMVMGNTSSTSQSEANSQTIDKHGRCDDNATNVIDKKQQQQQQQRALNDYGENDEHVITSNKADKSKSNRPVETTPSLRGRGDNSATQGSRRKLHMPFKCTKQQKKSRDEPTLRCETNIRCDTNDKGRPVKIPTEAAQHQRPDAAPQSGKLQMINEHDTGNEDYIDEYKSFVEEKQHLIGSTPQAYPLTETFNFEDVLNLSAPPRQSLLANFMPKNNSEPPARSVNIKMTTSLSAPTMTAASGGAVKSLPVSKERRPQSEEPAKTPEEIEYEAVMAAECADVMTPLPTTAKQFPLGRNLQPEIVEIIRNLDANAMRINNLTSEDKVELLRRYESRRHSRGRNVSISLNDREAGDQHDDGDTDSDCEGVVLRRPSGKPERPMSTISEASLFERRLPKSPKLKLMVKSKSGGDAGGSTKSLRKQSALDMEKNLMDFKYPTVLPPNPPLKALLVFHKADNVCEVLTQACHRHQMDVQVVKSKEAALDSLTASAAQTECYHIIIIDARSPKYLDAEYLTRTIRHMTGHHFTTIIAVVKKSFFEKDDILIALLDAGVNRCMIETTNISLCSTEIKQIFHSIIRPHNVMSTQQALYTALHRIKEVLIITDDVLRIQYANKSSERLLNMRLDEIINRPLAEIFISDVSSINTHGKSNKEFDGILTVRRKSHDGIPMHVRVVPVACIGRSPTHYVFNFDNTGSHADFIATLPQPKEAPRGSLHSIRRGSFDVRSVASDGLRRTSLAKLTSLPLEAPITKENCSSDEARLIDKVLEFLKREGLYSPQMKEIRTEDPIATDLIGALLTGPSLYSSRRSSNDSIIRTSSRPCGIMASKMKSTPLIMELLEESLSWEFDIFKLEDITERRPLLYLGMEMFRRFDVFATFNIDENICKSWLAVIEANYHAQNSYHNSTHAADVMQATGAFITQLASKEIIMDRMDEAAALIAAATHDIDHPGRSSAFLCNSNSPLAILYNDLTVLESHHAATTFKLTLADDKVNIFKNLDSETYKSVRSTIIDMILATEMTRHFEHLAKFVSVFGNDGEPRDVVQIVQTEDESSVLIRRMLIKVADVSNPARPPSYSMEWARRIAEEYFMQTDEEKANALPIVMPMFDRATCSIPKSQIGFIEYIIQDMMHAWDGFIDMPQLITYMQINYSQWKKFEDQGIHTLADIKNKLLSMNTKKTSNAK